MAEKRKFEGAAAWRRRQQVANSAEDAGAPEEGIGKKAAKSDGGRLRSDESGEAGSGRGRTTERRPRSPGDEEEAQERRRPPPKKLKEHEERREEDRRSRSLDRRVEYRVEPKKDKFRPVGDMTKKRRPEDAPELAHLSPEQRHTAVVSREIEELAAARAAIDPARAVWKVFRLDACGNSNLRVKTFAETGRKRWDSEEDEEGMGQKTRTTALQSDDDVAAQRSDDEYPQAAAQEAEGGTASERRSGTRPVDLQLGGGERGSVGCSRASGAEGRPVLPARATGELESRGCGLPKGAGRPPEGSGSRPLSQEVECAGIQPPAPAEPVTGRPQQGRGREPPGEQSSEKGDTTRTARPGVVRADAARQTYQQPPGEQSSEKGDTVSMAGPSTVRAKSARQEESGSHASQGRPWSAAADRQDETPRDLRALLSGRARGDEAGNAMAPIEVPDRPPSASGPALRARDNSVYFGRACPLWLKAVAVRVVDAASDVVRVSMDRVDRYEMNVELLPRVRDDWTTALDRLGRMVREDLAADEGVTQEQAWAQMAQAVNTCYAAWQRLQVRSSSTAPPEVQQHAWREMQRREEQPMASLVAQLFQWADEMCGRLRGTNDHAWATDARERLRRGQANVQSAIGALAANEAMAELVLTATGDAFSCMIQVAGTTARYRVARDKAKERELDRQNFKIQEPTLENDARVARWRNARFEIQAERDAEGGPTAVRAAKAVVEQRHEERRRAGRAAGFEGPTRQAVPRTELEIADSVADVQGLSRTVAEGLSVAECGDEEWDVEEGYLLARCPAWARGLHVVSQRTRRLSMSVKVRAGDPWDRAVASKMVDTWLASARAIHDTLRRMARHQDWGNRIGATAAAVARVIEGYVVTAMEWEGSSATYAVETAQACHRLAAELARQFEPDILDRVEKWAAKHGQPFAGDDDEIMPDQPVMLQELCRAANRLVIVDQYALYWERELQHQEIRVKPKERPPLVVKPWEAEHHTLSRARIAEAVDRTMTGLLDLTLTLARTKDQWLKRVVERAVAEREEVESGRRREVQQPRLSAMGPGYAQLVTVVPFDWTDTAARAGPPAYRMAPMMAKRGSSQPVTRQYPIKVVSGPPQK